MSIEIDIRDSLLLCPMLVFDGLKCQICLHLVVMLNRLHQGAIMTNQTSFYFPSATSTAVGITD